MNIISFTLNLLNHKAQLQQVDNTKRTFSRRDLYEWINGPDRSPGRWH